ncbi:MAG: peptidoglycan DD-metalloendopeptidase family protein [Clostridia bacterium]|nr:peptidoglycan DD-metalloendopeptidase family protein [Clostridia bacterium]
MIGLCLISLKYKPTYVVETSGIKLGYVNNKSNFEEKITSDIREYSGKNVVSVSLNEEPCYELKFIDRSIDTNEEEIIAKLQEDATVTYKYYEVALNDEEKTYVNTEEEAKEVVREINETTAEKEIELDFKINEIITEDTDQIKTESIEVAKETLLPEVEQEVEKIEEERSAPVVNEIRLAVHPVSGTISSRFGVRSRIRSSTHTGLDIACATGTPIKVVAGGTVSSVTSGGAYGNLIKVNHGNGVETWYAHCSKIYATQGQTVNAGDVIAAVGSTGNSTGPHLHLEIRIDGIAINPQQYLYK